MIGIGRRQRALGLARWATRGRACRARRPAGRAAPRSAGRRPRPRSCRSCRSRPRSCRAGRGRSARRPRASATRTSGTTRPKTSVGRSGTALLAHDGDGAAFDRLRHEGQPVGLGARHGEEHVAGLDRPAVDREARRPRGREPGDRRPRRAGARRSVIAARRSCRCRACATQREGLLSACRGSAACSRSGATRSMILPQTSPEFQAAVW